MQNFVKDGDTIKYVNASGSTINSGAPVFIPGGKVCIAMEKILDTATGLLKTEGVYELAKHAPLVISQGDKLFWSGTEVTKTVTDVFLGFAHEAAASADTTVFVDIDDAQGGAQLPNQAAVATADASDLATAITLVNAMKAAHNALLTKLIAAGKMDGG